MYLLSSFGLLVARILICIIFLIGGFSKITHFDTTAQFMAAHGVTLVPFFLIAAIVIEIIGGLSILLGWKLRWGAALLFIYLIPVTLIMHDFWYADAASRMEQQINFLKNLAIEGGLLYLVVHGAGSWSVDGCIGCSSKRDIK